MTIPADFAFVDAHCHVDLYERPEEVAAEAQRAGVCTIAVTNAPFVFEFTAALAKRHPLLRPALGLHPELVRTHGRQIDDFRRFLPQTRFVGEVGLDHTTSDPRERQDQRVVLDRILAWCAETGDKVLTVHSRRASAEVVAAIGERYPSTVILHWFSGPARDLERAAALGCYFSVNAAMTRSRNGLRLLEAMPVDRVFTETDGPFVQSRRVPDRPSDVARVVEELGRLWRCDVDEAAARIRGNFDTAVRGSNPI